MPSNRRLKAGFLILVLTILIVLYLANGAKNTRNSAFYTRTVEALTTKQQRAAQEAADLESKQRLEREERIRKEHDAAIAAALAKDSDEPKSDAEKFAGVGAGADKEKPLAQDVKEAVGAVKDAVTGGQSEKSVAGRKMMKDGDQKIVVNGKGEGDDGVAKVGNVGPKVSDVVAGEKHGPETEQDHKVEVEMNSILKKGPIIIFSKSYCPYSKKAKHVLLDLYSITPPPYVVELDQHELGPGLQAALNKSTGRRTVPNILINGKSIGGGDEVQKLHEEGKLAEMVMSMGGRRVMEAKRLDEGASRVGLRFKA